MEQNRIVKGFIDVLAVLELRVEHHFDGLGLEKRPIIHQQTFQYFQIDLDLDIDVPPAL